MGSHRDYLPTTQFSYPPPTANGNQSPWLGRLVGRKISLFHIAIGLGREQEFEMGSHRDYLPTTQFSYPPSTANGKPVAMGRKI